MLRPLLAIAFLLTACAPAAQQTPAALAPAPAPAPIPSTALPMPTSPLARFADLKQDAAGKVRLSDAQWQKRLTPLQYEVTRHGATEYAGTGAYENTETDGTYHCICCGQSLYGAQNKFHSGCGWPAFDDEVAKGAITYRTDADGRRTEILCSRCDAHLGHVFHNEGLSKTNVRHCVNSASLLLVPKEK